MPLEPPIQDLLDEFDHLPQAEHMELALAALVASSTKPDGNPTLSIRRTAQLYAVPRSTLTDQWNGTPTCREGHAHEMLLTSAWEEVFVEQGVTRVTRG